jgi:hypothetical protein
MVFNRPNENAGVQVELMSVPRVIRGEIDIPAVNMKATGHLTRGQNQIVEAKRMNAKTPNVTFVNVHL